MRGWVSKLQGFVTVLAAVGFVALAGVGGWLYWNRVQLRSEQAARAELAPLAAGQIPKVFAYDYQTVERSLTDAYTLLTPEYRQEFEDRAANDIIPQARERQVVSQANVVGVGVLTAQRDSASVMVFMNRTVTDKSRQPVYDGSRLRVDYQKIDGKWLIRYITLM
ncbi:MAG: mammalian cell entry protein [Mycobacterium sp.]